MTDDEIAEFQEAGGTLRGMAIIQRLQAENARLLADRTKAGRSIYEAQLHAYSVLEYSGATKVDHKDRTPEQAAAVEMYSYVHDAAKMLVGRLDIEHDDQRALASELKVELAVVRTALTAAEQALAEVWALHDEIVLKWPTTMAWLIERLAAALTPSASAHDDEPTKHGDPVGGEGDHE